MISFLFSLGVSLVLASDTYTPQTLLARLDHPNIFINQRWDLLRKYLDTDDRLSLIIINQVVFNDNSIAEKWQGFDVMLEDVINQLHGGYVNLFYYDCLWIETNPSNVIATQNACLPDEIKFQPTFVLIKPPYSRINPYDGKEIASQMLHFPSTEVSTPGIKQWILQNLPNYSQNLRSSDDLEKFRSTSSELIAKVYLLSSKQTTPQIYSALTATYRDRLDFAFIVDESAAAIQFKQMYDIKSVPVLMIELTDQETREIYSGSMKLPDLVQWLKPYALDEKLQHDQQKATEMYSMQEIQNLGDKIGIIKSWQEFEHIVLSHDKATLVYFSTETKKPHLPTFMKFAEEHGIYIKCVWYIVDNLQELKQNFKPASNLPVFRSFKNKKLGLEKLESSTQVYLSSSGEDDLNSLLLEVLDNYESDVKQISEAVFQTMVMQITDNELNPKYVVCYLFDDDIGISLAIKALSMDLHLKEDFEFLAIEKPTFNMIKIEDTLPTVIGVMRKTDKYPAGSVFRFDGMKTVEFTSLKKTLIDMLPGLKDRITQNDQGKRDSKGLRKLAEIKNQHDLRERCFLRNWCGIGLFNADEPAKIEQLTKLAERGQKRSSQLYYSWINVTCHPEVLTWFGLSSFSVPTVLYFQPKHNRFSELIGTFDYDNVASQEDKITNGAFPARHAPIQSEQMQLQKACAKQEEVYQDEDDDFAEMLAEILREEEAQKALLEEISSDKNKKKQKKKKSSKKGKDEL